MSQRLTLTPERERARDAVRGLARPRPDPEFRATLKRAFVQGAIPAAAAPVEPTVAAREPSWWRHPLGLRWALAPAALAVLAVALVIADRGPGWKLAAATGDGVVVLGDRPISARHGEELQTWMRPGTRVRVSEGTTLEILTAGTLAFQISPGTEFYVPKAPGRWFDRGIEARVLQGEVRITTGPRFPGAALRVTTPEAEIELRGTTIAVICEPAGTCVCVHDGVAMVGAAGGPLTPVRPGERRFVFRDGTTPEHAHIRETEVDPLEEFRARGREMLAR